MDQHERVNKVSKWVDDWFEANRGEIDVGQTKLGIDILPDEVEKALYSIVILIAMSLAEESELRLAGQRVRLSFEADPDG